MLNLSLGFVIGSLVGSFVLCAADRSVTGKSLRGRSYCEYCKKQLHWYDLFPVLSYLLLRGRCRYCHNSIKLEYLLIECLMGLLVAYIFVSQLPPFLNLPFSWISLTLTFVPIVFKIFIVSVFVAIFITDFKTGLIPDRITYPASISALIYLLVLTPIQIYALYQSLSASAVGRYLLPPYSSYFYNHSYLIAQPALFSLLAALILGIFFALLIIVTRGRGMGGGDLKLVIFMGLALGLHNSLIAVFLAFLTGSIAGTVLWITRLKRLGQTIAFGPYLSLGGILALFWGQQIYNWYFKVLSTPLF